MSKIQEVCVSAGRVDGYTCGEYGLRVSGSLGGKVGELLKMKEAFVLKCCGTQNSPANLPTNCKRIPQGCLTVPKGTEIIEERCHRCFQSVRKLPLFKNIPQNDLFFHTGNR